VVPIGFSECFLTLTKGNSEHPGHRGDAKPDPGLKDEWRQPQRKSEGKCWTGETDNTYTGKGGSKRD